MGKRFSVRKGEQVLRLPLKSLRRFPGAESRKVSIFAPRGKLRCAKIVLGAAKLPLRREVEGDTPSSFPAGDAAALARFARGAGVRFVAAAPLPERMGREAPPPRTPWGSTAALAPKESGGFAVGRGNEGASLRSLGENVGRRASLRSLGWDEGCSLARRGCISGCKRI